jgi:nucleotide-binding universal stress UspA family protein
VGLADGPVGGATLAWALREATATRADLVVVRADVARQVLGPVARGSLRTLELVDASLARAVGAARRVVGEDRVHVVVDRDPAASVLIGAAGPGDLLVVGAPTRSGWWARASTTYRVITRACCPVVVVHPYGRRGPYPDRVVVGVDGSPGSRAALEFAFAYAAQHSLSLVAATGGDGEAVEPWRSKYPEVPVGWCLVGADPLTDLRAAAEGAALLVVGTAGTGPAQLGSVARGLVEHAGCPVAVLRADMYF